MAMRQAKCELVSTDILQVRICNRHGESGAIESVATPSFHRSRSRRECWRNDKREREKGKERERERERGPRFSVCQRREVQDNNERADGAKSMRTPAVQTGTRCSGDARELTTEGGGPRRTTYQEECRRRPRPRRRCRLLRLLRRQREKEGPGGCYAERAPLRADAKGRLWGVGN